MSTSERLASRRTDLADERTQLANERTALANERTRLASERTMLAYARTALALVAGGVTLPKLFPDSPGIAALGVVLFSLGLVVAVVGVVRFATLARRMRHLRKASPP
ncbi:MAG: DUF202 domain-containing protein [Bacteroidota bacterium]